MLFEIKKLGFLDLELSFNLTEGMVSEIGPVASREGFRVKSVHNYCPIPPGFERITALPDCFSMSSLDQAERKLAIKYTKKTIDTANKLGADSVVLHCGRVEMQDRTRRLIELYPPGQKETDIFSSTKEDFIRERASIAAPFFDNTLDSLKEICRYAQDKGISLGIENRFYYREIPSFEETNLILESFKGLPVFYWHDTGHAQVMENLGFSKHLDYLEAYSKRMLGVHFHNIVGCDDHQAPVNGEFDFSKLKPYIKKDTVKVIEAHHPATPHEIIKSKKMLEDIFNGIA
jgi:sugar phosphate isomerase/epimerase